MSHSQEVINAKKRGIRVEIEHHTHILETLRASLAELEKDNNTHRVEKALHTIEQALARDVPLPKSSYADGINDGIKMACEEIKKVLLSDR